MAKALTQKQENFCRLFVELGNQSEAYRQSYNSNAKHESVNQEASRMMALPHIASRVEELRRDIAMAHNITVESLLSELEEARTIALTCETPQSSAAVTATMGKAKLCGLDKQVIDHNVKIVDDGSNEW